MIEAYDQFFDVDIEKFIYILADIFHFNKLTKKGDELYMCCPFHSNGQERTPSASFKLKGEHPGEFYCFGCKTRGYLSSILTKLFGSKKKAIFWLQQNFKTLDIDKKRDVHKIEPEAPSVNQEFELPLSLIDNHTDYFNSRGIPDELVKKYRLMYSPRRDAVIFPVWDGDIITFYQIRYLNSNSNLKWYIPEGAIAKVFGKEFIKPTGPVYVCESCFNALTMEKFGYNAVSMFGARFDDTRFELLELPNMKFIIAYDGDDAGRLNSKQLAKFLKDSGRLVEVLKMPDGKDINDFANLTQEEFDNKIKEWRSKK